MEARNYEGRTVNEWIEAHGNLTKKGKKGREYEGPCPRPDCPAKTDGFHVKENGSGRALVGCRGCIDGGQDPDGEHFGEITRKLFGDEPALPASLYRKRADHRAAPSLYSLKSKYHVSRPAERSRTLPIEALLPTAGWESFRQLPPAALKHGGRAAYSYLTADGELFATVHVSFKPGQEKKVWQSPPPPAGAIRPLYQLPQVLDDTDKNLLIVEGEKSVHGAAALPVFPGYQPTTTLGGASNPHLTDWQPVEGRHVLIWPDNDEPGRAYAQAVAGLCRDAGAESIAIVDVPAEWPEKWDLADPLPEGVDLDELAELARNAPDAFKPSIISLADLLAEPDELEPWLVDHLLTAGGLSLIASKPGAGKTTLVEDMALSVSQGRTWLGRDVRQGPVVYYCLDQHRRFVREHFQAMGADGGEPLYLHFDPIEGDPIKKLSEYVETYNPVLILIDMLAQFFDLVDRGGKDGTVNYAMMSKHLTPLRALAERTGVHIALVHHGRKGEASEDSILGSTALTGRVDTVLLLDRDGEERNLRTTKQRGSGDPLEPTIIELDAFGRLVLGESKAKAKGTSIEADILLLLSNREEPMPRDEVIGRVSGSESDASKALIRLRSDGKITKVKVGRKDAYSISANSA